MTWFGRSRVGLFIVPIAALVAIGCGSSVRTPASTTDASTAPPTVAPTSMLAASTTGASTTTAASPTATEARRARLQLDRLPGRIAVVSTGCGGGTARERSAICIYNPDGSSLVEVKADGPVEYLNWTWDGSSLLFQTGSGSFSVAKDGTGLAPRDPLAKPMTSQSPDGKLSVFTRIGQVGFWLSPAGSPRTDRRWQQVTSGADDCCDFARWSTDSRYLLYSVGVGNGVCGRLSSVEVATKTTTEIIGAGTTSGSSNVCVTTDSARWSPDGTTVLFLDEGPTADISIPMLVDADGSNLRPLLADTSMLPAGWMVTAVAWSPDGSAIAMSIVHDMGTGLYIVSPDGTQVVPVGGLPVGAIPLGTIVWAPGL